MALRASDDNAARGRTARSYPLGPEGSLSGGVTLRAWHAVAVLALATLVIGWPWLSGRRDHPLGCQGALPAADPVPGAEPRRRSIAVLGALRLQRPSADRRSAVDDLLAAVPRCWRCSRPRPSLWAVDATVLAMVFLGGCALMLWFRDQGWHWAGGLIAALAFCYGASMAWRIQHIGQVLSLAYLPIAMLCLDRALARRSIVYGAAAGRRRGAASCWAATRWRCSRSIFLPGFALWRLLSAPAPLAAVARQLRCRWRPARSRARADRRADAADRAAGRRIQPPVDRLHRRRPRLAASRPAADARDARTCSAPRAAWRTTGARRALPGPTPASSSPRTWASSTSARSRCCCC